MSKKDKRGIKQTFKEIDVDGDGWTAPGVANASCSEELL